MIIDHPQLLVMKILPIILISLTFVGLSYNVRAQEIIELNNPSFEDAPHGGKRGTGIRGWYDCALNYFPMETPPDVHPARNESPFFGVTKSASDGETYLGMVTRDVESWESVSQILSSPLIAGQCYTFSIDLSQSAVYKSPTKSSDREEPYTNGVVLRIWGGVSACKSNQLLAESTVVNHKDWQTYTFEFNPNVNYRSITLEAFYKTPVLDPYNGHILIDNASPITQIPCPGDEILAVAKPKSNKATPPHKRRKPKTKPKKDQNTNKALVSPPKTKEKVLKELDRSKIYKGQKINIDNLYYAANETEVNEKSYDVLDEVVDFLKKYTEVKVEIGGHTNRKPKPEFCDSLSRLRAKAVAEYINKKGVKARQLQFKGYGKKKPLSMDNTQRAHKRNQRVEIKILSIGS